MPTGGGEQLHLQLGFKLTKDSEQNKQKIIKGIQQIQQSTGRQASAIQQSGQQVGAAGRQLSLFGDNSNKSAKQLTMFGETTIQSTGSVKNLASGMTDLSNDFKHSTRQGNLFSKETRESTKNLNQKKKVVKDTGDGLRKMGYDITFVAWHLRFLGNILTNVGRQMTQTIKGWIKTGSELQDRFFGLATSAVLYGESADDARKAAENLALKGLVPLAASTEAYNNILLTGAFTVDQATDFLERFLDVSTLVTAGQDEMSNSMTFLTQSILRGTMVLGTDVVTRALWNMTEKRVQATRNKSLSQLSAMERATQIMITLQQDFNDILGLHEIRMALIGASVTKMNERYETLQGTLAEALWPAIIAVSDAFVFIADAIERVIEKTGNFFPAIIIGNTILVVLIGTILTATAVTLSFAKITSFGTTMLIAYQKIVETNIATNVAMAKSMLWKAKAAKILEWSLNRLYPILFVLSLAVSAATYLWMRYSGSINKAETAQEELVKTGEKMNQVIKEGGELFGMAGESDEKAAKSQEKAHYRRLEDLEEALERERSKGLWADQMKIKDLEKRIKREKEDYAELQESKEDSEESGRLSYEDMIKSMVDETEIATGKIKGFWRGLGNVFKWLGEKWNDVHGGIKLAIIAITTFLLPKLYMYLAYTLIPKIAALGTILASFFTMSVGGAIGGVMTKFGILAALMGPGLALTIFVTGLSALYLAIQRISTLKDLADETSRSIEEAAKIQGEITKNTVKDWKNGLISREKAAELLAEQLEMSKELVESSEEHLRNMDEYFSTRSRLHSMLTSPARLGEGIYNTIASGWGHAFSAFGIGRQSGHIQVPGKVGQPVPTILHGGERIIPHHETGVTGGDTVNIYYPSVRNDDDITKLANAVSDVLARKQRWAKRGAY